MSDEQSAGGTCTLLIEREEGGPIEGGVLGEVDISAGWYAYVGSALGPGGFARVDRHARVASRGREGYHWHVDSLLGDGASRLDCDRRSPGTTSSVRSPDALPRRSGRSTAAASSRALAVRTVPASLT